MQQNKFIIVDVWYKRQWYGCGTEQWQQWQNYFFRCISYSLQGVTGERTPTHCSMPVGPSLKSLRTVGQKPGNQQQSQGRSGGTKTKQHSRTPSKIWTPSTALSSTCKPDEHKTTTPNHQEWKKFICKCVNHSAKKKTCKIHGNPLEIDGFQFSDFILQISAHSDPPTLVPKKKKNYRPIVIARVCQFSYLFVTPEIHLCVVMGSP